MFATVERVWLMLLVAVGFGAGAWTAVSRLVSMVHRADPALYFEHAVPLNGPEVTLHVIGAVIFTACTAGSLVTALWLRRSAR